MRLKALSSKITAIIPFKLDATRPDLGGRVVDLTEQCVQQGVNVVVVQDLTDGDEPLTLPRLDQQEIKLVTYSSSNSTFSLARARNRGLNIVTTLWSITLDADLVLPETFFKSLNVLLNSGIARSKTFFLTLPVIYLSQQVNAENLSGVQSFGEVIYGDMKIDHWVLGSSVIIARTAHLKGLGGYHEAYCGWGYEDHDMAMQLVSQDPTFITAYDSNVFDPRPMQDVTRYVGWRAKYSLYGRLALSYNLFLLHVYHPVSNSFSNKNRVSLNEMKFNERLSNVKFPIFDNVVFDIANPIYNQYHLYFEQLHLGKTMAAIRSFLLRSRSLVRLYRKIRRLD